jgi:hypothetical protein
MKGLSLHPGVSSDFYYFKLLFSLEVHYFEYVRAKIFINFIIRKIYIFPVFVSTYFSFCWLVLSALGQMFRGLSTGFLNQKQIFQNKKKDDRRET